MIDNWTDEELVDSWINQKYNYIVDNKVFSERLENSRYKTNNIKNGIYQDIHVKSAISSYAILPVASMIDINGKNCIIVYEDINLLLHILNYKSKYKVLYVKHFPDFTMHMNNYSYIFNKILTTATTIDFTQMLFEYAELFDDVDFMCKFISRKFWKDFKDSSKILSQLKRKIKIHQIVNNYS